MTESVPDFIDPLSLAKKGADMQVSIPIALMPRVAPALMAPEGEVEVVLRFRREAGVVAIEGSVVAELPLQCQCCMERMIWRVDSPVKLGVVATLEEANLLPE